MSEHSTTRHTRTTAASGTPVIVVAPDKFKGSLTAREVAQALADGLQTALPDAEVRQVPVADGGEGTVEAAVSAGFSRQSITVTGPVPGTTVEAAWALRERAGGGPEAVVELAQASGIELLPPGELAPGTATSRGTGEVLAAALAAGARRIVLGLGGSACTDAGTGMLAALGAEFLDEHGQQVPDGGAHLGQVRQVSLAGLDRRWREVELVLASDVDHPLTGPHGAAAVFGPQKGLTEDDVPAYDASIAQVAEFVAEAAGRQGGPEAQRRVLDTVTQPGAGAAGGAGFAALAVLGAQRRRGIEVVLELARLDDALTGADLVLTGEGSLDEQSLEGKTPVGIADAAARHGLPVEAVCGRTLLSPEQASEAGIRRVWALSDREPDVEQSMRRAAELLQQVGREIAESFARSSSVATPVTVPDTPDRLED